jgi:anti-sigma regulatory factor (Ser/Thr protein kinase)
MRAALTLRSEMGELPRLVAFATEFAERAKLPLEELNRLLVILDELVSNIVRHGYEGAVANGAIEVVLSFARSRLGIEITDNGRAFDPLSAPPPDLDLPAAERPLGGLGIHIVKALVDEARYHRRGKCNRLVLTRRIHLDMRT